MQRLDDLRFLNTQAYNYNIDLVKKTIKLLKKSN